MPRRADLHRIMIVGSGPIVIGQACEFDYSGTQACKALKAEGFEVSLVNSNPATIMTDPSFADRTYIEPLEPESVLRILERERPDALLPTIGGQTALNVAVALGEAGELDRLGIRLIGASLEAIRRAEDRSAFKETMVKAGLDVPRAEVAYTLERAMAIGEAIGYPLIVRPSFTLGGGEAAGSRTTAGELEALAARSLEISPVGRDPRRGVDRGMEGVRARDDARRRGQRRDRVLDRERGSHGRAHGRLDHRGAAADPDRPRIPADARRGAAVHPRDRRRDGRVERAVRRRARPRADRSSSR